MYIQQFQSNWTCVSTAVKEIPGKDTKLYKGLHTSECLLERHCLFILILDLSFLWYPPTLHVHRVQIPQTLGQGIISDIWDILFLVSDWLNCKVLPNILDIYIKWLATFFLDFPGWYWVLTQGLPNLPLPIACMQPHKNSREDIDSCLVGPDI